MADGLSHNSVNHIIQDSEGFIWIGTDNGLNRFDGRTFKVFRHLDSDSTSVCGNIIKDIKESSDGTLWIATADGGICHYDRKTSKFKKKFIPTFPDEPFPPSNAICLGIRKDGEIWVGFEKSRMFHFYPGKEGDFDGAGREEFWSRRVYDFIETEDGNFYCGPLGRGINRKTDSGWEDFNPDSIIPYFGMTINTLKEHQGKIYCGNWDNTLYEFDEKNKSCEIVTFTNANVRQSSTDEIRSIEFLDDWIWLGTRYNGLVLYNSETRQKKTFKPLSYDPYSINSIEVNAICKDSDGRMWLGTSNGISVYDPLKYQFNVEYLGGEILNADASEKVNVIHEDQGSLWIGTQKGMWRENEDGSFHFVEVMNSNFKNQVHSFYRDSKDRMWIGTNEAIQYIDEEKNTLRHLNTFHKAMGFEKDKIDTLAVGFVPYNIGASRYKSITEIHDDGRDLLLLSPYGHGTIVVDFNTLSGYITIFTIGKEISFAQRNMSLSENLVMKTIQDSQGQVWTLGKSKGFLHSPEFHLPNNFEGAFDNQGYKTLVFDLPDFDYSNIRSKQVLYNNEPLLANAYEILELEDGSYYGSTYDKGLYHITKTGDSTYVASKIPSPTESFEGMQLDDTGNLWLISSGGFYRYEIESEFWQRYDFRDGFPDQGVAGYILKREDGTFAAGGSGYIVTFDPASIKKNVKNPSIELTNFIINNKDAEGLLSENKVQLHYEENYIGFEFASLNYTNPLMNQFQYRLKGLSDEWIYLDKQNFVNFADLEGGHYEFQLKGSNNHGVWNETPVTYAFEIIPPFWKRPWFTPLLAISALLFGIAFYRMRLRRMKKLQLEQLTVEVLAQEKERKRISEDLHDDLGTRMSALKLYMNTLQNYLINEPQAQKVSSSAQNLLDESIGDLRGMLTNLSPLTVSKFGFFRATEDLCQRLSQTGAIDIRCAFHNSTDRFNEASELALYRITQELINNAIKHSKCTNVLFKVEENDQWFHYTYTDNGIGIDGDVPSSKNGTGLGLKNIENRVRLEGGKYSWESTPNQGLRINLSIPVTHTNDK